MKYSLQFLIPNLNNILAFRFYYNFIGFCINFSSPFEVESAARHSSCGALFNLYALIAQFHLLSPPRDNRKECKQSGSNLSAEVSIEKASSREEAPPSFN